MRPVWRKTITRLRAELVTDDYGTPAAERDWANATATEIPGCDVQPIAGKEISTGREAITTRYRLFAPAGTDLLPTDRVVYAAATYEVDGDVATWDDGALHVEAILTRVVG